jgi:hypothetical protein
MKKSKLVFATMLAGLAALVPGGPAVAGGRPDPAAFTGRVTNPWFPLKPGTTYVYRGTRDASRRATS